MKVFCTLLMQERSKHSVHLFTLLGEVEKSWFCSHAVGLFRLLLLLGATTVTSSSLWCQEPGTNEYPSAFIHSHTFIRDVSRFSIVHSWLRENKMSVQRRADGKRGHPLSEDGIVGICVTCHYSALSPLKSFVSWLLTGWFSFAFTLCLGRTGQVRLEYLQVGGVFWETRCPPLL